MKMAKAPGIVNLLIAVVSLIVLTMWAYYPTTSNSFVWDTKTYLFGYEFWISKLHPYHIVWMFLSLDFYNYHPLTWLSWALDYQLYGGMNAWGFHFSNNILHTLNSVLVFFLTLVIFGLNDPKSTHYPLRKDNNALIAAFLAALLFAVHPQHVESVAWIAERKDLLFQLFLLLATFVYVKYATCVDELKSRWFYATLGLFLMALLSKPMAVTFPVVLVLLDTYPLRRFLFISQVNNSIRQHPTGVLLWEKLPFFLLSISSILLTLVAQQKAMANISFDLRVLNAFNSILFYLTKLFVPLHFTPQYPYFLDVGQSVTWKAFMPVIGVLGITLATLFAWTKRQYAWLVAWLFYLITLSPALGLIQVGAQGAADRYAYLPTLPVYLFIGAGILYLMNRTSVTIRFPILLVSFTVAFFLTDKTRQQIGVWKNDLSLWSNAIQLMPDNDLAYLNIGSYYYNVHEFEKASFYFEKAGALRPNEARIYAWRALTYTYLKQYEKAINFHVKLGSAIESHPELGADQYCIQYNIGWLFAMLNSFPEAIELFSRVNPSSALGHDALQWLNWLENNKQSINQSAPPENLPGFCTRLLPMMGVGEESRD